jgi:hypothetical protein
MPGTGKFVSDSRSKNQLLNKDNMNYRPTVSNLIKHRHLKLFHTCCIMATCSLNIYAMAMVKTLGYQLKALGAKAMPALLRLPGGLYKLERIFKHDFFAATAVYILHDPAGNTPSSPQHIVLKIARQADFIGIPLRWLGQTMTHHEWSILSRLHDIQGVPRLIARFGHEGLLYRFIEGVSLDEKPDNIPDDYFDRLSGLLSSIHLRNIAYIDLNKRGNILLTEDRSPALVDFQIACYLPAQVWGLGPIFRFVLNILQKEDLYHCRKHKRRLRADLLKEEELASSRRPSLWIAVHRAVAAPYRRLRRKILDYLYRHDGLVDGQISRPTPESDPARWNRNNK